MPEKHKAQRKRTDRGVTVEAIVDAATTMFLRKGYRDTSTDEIAALAGVSKQTIYRNFPDKDVLFDTIVRGVIDRVQSFLRDATLVLGATRDLRGDLREVAKKCGATASQADLELEANEGVAVFLAAYATPQETGP